MLRETESGDPWRESLAANEALETEFELFGGFRKVRAEASPRGFKAQQNSDSSKSLGVTKCLPQGFHGEIIVTPVILRCHRAQTAQFPP